MKIAVVQLLSLLLFIIGLSVYADETSLEGAYIWTLKSPDGNEFVEKIYFKNKNNKLMLYLEGEQYECSLSGTHFSGQMYIQQRVWGVSGDFQSDGKITGKQERWDVFTPEEKLTLTFEAVRDTSEEAQKFWPQYLQEWEAHLASLDKKPDWDATEEGRQQKEGLLALAAEQHVTLTVRGKVVDSTGKPLEGIVLRCGTQRIDINYSMGLAAAEEYITTDWGDAELRNCLGGYAEKRGGSGTEAGLHVCGGGRAAAVGCTFIGNAIAVDADQKGEARLAACLIAPTTAAAAAFTAETEAKVAGLDTCRLLTPEETAEALPQASAGRDGTGTAFDAPPGEKAGYRNRGTE